MNKLAVLATNAAVLTTVLSLSVGYAGAATTPHLGTAREAGSTQEPKSTVGTPSSTSTSTSVPASGGELATIKQRCDNAIKQRLSEINTLTAAVNASKSVTTQHKSALLAELGADASGLQALDAQIQGDTTAAAIKTDAPKIVNNYRIYVLEVPKVHDVLAADALTNMATSLTNSSSRLSAALARAQARGVDVTAADAALADLNTQASGIASNTNGVADNVLALEPSGYPGNQSTLQTSRQSLGTALKDAKAARADLTTISSALHAGAGTSTSATNANQLGNGSR